MYLVTGATGFIGSNVVEQLAILGERVVALSNRLPSARQQAMFEGAAIPVVSETGDVRDRARMEALLRTHGVKRIIHCAAITPNADRERTAGDQVIDVNITGSAAMCAAALGCGIERFVLVSSSEVFGIDDLADGSYVDEESQKLAGTLYGISKIASEQIVGRMCDLHGVSCAIGRIGTAFGPWEDDTGFRDTLSPIYQLHRLASEGGLAVLAHDKRTNWHYGRDAGASLAVLARADRLEHVAYNLGPRWTWSISEWCRLLQAIHPKFSFEVGPHPNVDLYGGGDGGILSWDRFEKELGPTSAFDLRGAFDDFLEWSAWSTGTATRPTLTRSVDQMQKQAR